MEGREDGGSVDEVAESVDAFAPNQVQGVEAIGRVDGRANALTVLLPLRRGTRDILAEWLWVLRQRKLRDWAVGTLDRLRFVSAIRWSLIPPVEHYRFRRRGDDRWYLLFESNFDGDWDDYLEVFAAVMGVQVSSIVRWGRGYPGLTDVALFKAYAKAHDHEPDHYVSGYSRLTAGDVYQQREALPIQDPERRPSRLGYGLQHPRWTTLLLPIVQGRESEATRAARALDRPTDGCEQPILLRTGLLHFGRVVIWERPSGPWLLVTLTHDSTTEQVVAALVAADTDHGPWEPTWPPPPDPGGDDPLRDPDASAFVADPAESMAFGPGSTPLRRLFECCRDVPLPSAGWWADARLVAHLLAAQPRRHEMAYCGYPSWTVAELRAFDDDLTNGGTWWPVPERAG